MNKKKIPPKSPKKDLKETPLSKHTLWGWFFVFFIVCGFMFFLGVLVGRGTAPVTYNIDELEKDIKALKKTFSLNEENSTIKKLSDKPELEFYDALKNEKIDNKLITKKITQSEVPIPKKKYAEKTIKEKYSVDKTAKVDTENKKPIVETKNFVVDHSIEKEGRYTIQVAAFKKIEDADKLVNDLILKGYNAYRSIGKTKNNDIWYRVRIGGYPKKEDAKEMLNNLKKNNIKGILLNK